jgi:DNA excision repair protein ERCC-2
VQVQDFFAHDSFRPNQRELALCVYDNCTAGRILLTEAMSGFGKTAAVLGGAMLAARELGCRVVYTCRTKRQILRVVEELSLLQMKQQVKAASMFSKFDYCLLKKTSFRSVRQESFGWYCGFHVTNNLCSYFLNVSLLGNDTVDRLVQRTCYDIPKHSDLLQECERIHMCPYELVRLAMAQAEVIVVPYHYLFDPRAKPVLFDRNIIDRSRTILIVDEAHNIRDFLKGVQSATLTLDELAGARSEAQAMFMEETASSLGRLHEGLQKAIADAPGWFMDRASLVRELNRLHGEVWLQNLTFELSNCSDVAWHSVAYERKLPFLILKVGDFLNKLLSSPPSTVLTKWDKTFGLVTTNPVETLPALLGEFESSVLVSATINPSDLFLRSLGISAQLANVHVVQTAPSLVTVRTLIDTGVTTKYKSRTPDMYERIASKVAGIVASARSGVGVFTPSYSVLEPIQERVSKLLPERRIVSEVRGMSNQEASDLMESFSSGSRPVLFAVQSGRFSEGEDFRGNIMDSTVVVGLSLPPPSPQLYAEYTSLKQRGEPDSYLMLSLLPALRKAFQAAGRHLRNPGKKGLVFLLDRRFDSAVVRGLMPSWMSNNLLSGDFSPSQIEALVQEFWDGSSGLSGYRPPE